MIGGEFIIHGAQQTSRIDIVDPAFPGHRQGLRHSGNSFTITDEWYALKNMADDLHVILIQVTKGMKGHMYERPNFPITWARNYGKGRVFYTSMGHREDVWENPMYQGLLLGALGWATGRVEANDRAQHPQGDAEVRRAAELNDRRRSEPAASLDPPARRTIGSPASLDFVERPSPSTIVINDLESRASSLGFDVEQVAVDDRQVGAQSRLEHAEAVFGEGRDRPSRR